MMVAGAGSAVELRTLRRTGSEVTEASKNHRIL